MGFLTEYHDNEVTIGKLKFFINPAFDIVLQVQELFEEELSEQDKVEQALRMLVLNTMRLNWMDPHKKVLLLKEIYKKCINTMKHPPTRRKQRVLDFVYDGEYIYSSFMMDYGIDLIEEQGKLHWKKFIILFQGLSDRTKIREIMRIRAMDIPEYNGKNGKYVQEIQDLKSYYALPVKGGGGQSGLCLLYTSDAADD
mgnify:FL=1